MFKKSIYFSILILLVLSSCNSQNTPEATSIPPIPPTATSPIQLSVAQPEAGKANVVGQVISSTNNQPLANTIIRLAEVFRENDEGAFVLDIAFSPGSITDSQGYFTIVNITAMEYVLVVGDVYAQYLVVPDESGKAKVWEALPDQTLNIGELVVDYP